MYQALYRKWRPQSFDEVVGQSQVTDTLKNQVKNGRLSHAYLFIGTRGTGKTTCARILAKAINCENPENGNPCNRCKSCLGIDEGSVPDVVELDAASNNGVDNVRALRDEAVFSPAMAKKRVYIIDEVHMLSTAAFNALLKILEEPPAHLLFILATTELQKVPATILSRCQRHSFRRIEPELLAGQIRHVAQQEQMSIAPEAAELLARLADGSMRDGLSLLDQCAGDGNISLDSVLSSMGLAGNLRIEQLLDAVSSQDTEKALYIFEGLWNDGKAPASLLSELGALMRDVLMLKVAPKGGSGLISAGFARQSLERFAGKLSTDWLIFGINSLQRYLSSLRDGRDPRTVAELCLISLCEPELLEGPEALGLRVARLEKALTSGTPMAAARAEEKIPAPKVGSLPPRARVEASQPSTPTAAAPRPVAKAQEDRPPYDLEEPPTPTASPRLPAEPEEDNQPPFDLEEPSIISHTDTFSQQSSDPLSDFDTSPVSASDGFDQDFSAPPPVSEPLAPEYDSPEANEQPGSGDLWAGLLRLLSNTMQPGQYTIISGPMASGSFSETGLTIYAANSFVRGQLEQNSAMSAIRSAVLELCGRPVPVKILEKPPEQSGSAGLEGLAKFGGVVQFE